MTHRSIVRDAEIYLVDNYFTKEEADNLLKILNDEEKFKKYNLYFRNRSDKRKIVTVPSWRKSYWFGDYPQAVQTCGSDVPTDLVENYPFHPKILELKQRLEKEFGLSFNSCLVGKFDSPNDKIGFHSDASKSMGEDPYIASVSFGKARQFKLKKQKQHVEGYTTEQKTVLLKHVTVLIMKKDANRKYLHAVPKDRNCNEKMFRINLTFRNYKYHPEEIKYTVDKQSHSSSSEKKK